MSEHYDIEIWQGGQKVVSVYSSDPAACLREVSHYVAIYSMDPKDGPVTLRIKNPRRK